MPSPPSDADAAGRPAGRDAPPAARERFDRATRLHSRQEFDRVFGTGLKVVTRHVVARVRPLPDGRRTRVGLSVGRKVGNAPQRNRVKRCLRAAWREVAASFPEPVEVVLIARPRTAPTCTADALRALREVAARYRERFAGGGAGERSGGPRPRTRG